MRFVSPQRLRDIDARGIVDHKKGRICGESPRGSRTWQKRGWPAVLEPDENATGGVGGMLVWSFPVLVESGERRMQQTLRGPAHGSLADGLSPGHHRDDVRAKREDQDQRRFPPIYRRASAARMPQSPSIAREL